MEAGRGPDEDVPIEVLDPQASEGFARRGEVAQRPLRLVLIVDLAELRADEAVLCEVFEAVHDHLGRVEVALREHEGARRGRIHRGIAVGSDEPDEVESLAPALHERTTLGVDQRDTRVLGEMAGVVGEMRGEERIGDRVQLDPRDVRGVEVKSGQYLVAARRADDDDGRGGFQQLEGVGVVGGVVVGQRRRVAAVEAMHGGTDRAVVAQEDRGRVGRGEDVHAEDGAPAGKEHLGWTRILGGHRLDAVGDGIR